MFVVRSKGQAKAVGQIGFWKFQSRVTAFRNGVNATALTEGEMS